MNYELKEIEKNRSEFKITIEKPAFDAEVLKAYKRNVGRFNIPGFRKGKAPKFSMTTRSTLFFLLFMRLRSPS